MHPFILSCIHPLIHPSIQSFMHPSILSSFIHASFHSSIYPSILSFIHSSNQPSIHPFFLPSIIIINVIFIFVFIISTINTRLRHVLSLKNFRFPAYNKFIHTTYYIQIHTPTFENPRLMQRKQCSNDPL